LHHAASGGEHRIDFIWAKNAYAVAAAVQAAPCPSDHRPVVITARVSGLLLTPTRGARFKYPMPKVDQAPEEKKRALAKAGREISTG